MIANFFRIFIFLLSTFMVLNAEQLSDSLRLDGYGNVNIVQTKNEKDKLNFSAGLQGRYEITDNLSVTGQIHLKEGRNSNNTPSNSLEDYDSELKWLYFDYYLKNDLTLRAGAFQFPVFKSSETGDIGYTYTWTENPLGYYGVFGCDDFEGIELLKNFSYKDFDFLAQFSFGQSNNKLNDGRGDLREGEVDNLIGLTLKTAHENFIINLGYLQAKSTIDTSNQFIKIDSNVDFNMLALETEVYIKDYTLKSGLIKTNLTNVFPEDIRYYTSLEYNFGDFTPYILYSRETAYMKEISRKFPKEKIKQIQKLDKEKYSVGLRYDYSENIALKVSYSQEKNTLKYNSFNDDRNTNNIFIGSINVVF